MWPFKRKQSIADTGLLRGFTDWHSHLLPGVDDGVRTVDESLHILSLYEKLGINEVWLTPHIMEDMPNTTGHLRERFAALKEAYRGKTVLRLASENMLDNLFEERLAARDLLPLGEDGRHLLVETSYFNPPMGLHDTLLCIRAEGYTPVLAHPERYEYMNEHDYIHLKKSSVMFQLNIMSLVGAYGNGVRKKAEWLLKNGLCEIMGSDTHSLDVWMELVGRRQISENMLQMLKSIRTSRLPVWEGGV